MRARHRITARRSERGRVSKARGGTAVSGRPSCHVLTGRAKRYPPGAIVNAAGPWARDVLTGDMRRGNRHGLRLVRGSHIIVRRLFDHDQPYFLQLEDGRIIFAIPYERDFTLIGTTDVDHEGDAGAAACSNAERDYLCLLYTSDAADD